ncbi:MAG: hypothetical protein Q8M94_21860 [Ignavibacteria bacterium]|nr:hypothetical protein [Ignavibacteria bacterium]
MLLKLGVSVTDLKREIRRALPVIDLCFIKTLGGEAVITSTNEGSHSPGSLHYANLAVDVRLTGGYGRVLPVLRERLGPGFDVVEEKDHLHIEYDPKP